MKWNHEGDKSMRKGPVVEISMTASWSGRNTQILMAYLNQSCKACLGSDLLRRFAHSGTR